jgi:putative transposase
MGMRKSYKYKLQPTARQERLLDETVWRCRTLYNTALAQRIWAYRQCGVSVTRY